MAIGKTNAYVYRVDAVLEERSIVPTQAIQSVTPSAGYDGLSEVMVGAIPEQYIIPTGSITITRNGIHDVTTKASAVINIPRYNGEVV